MLSDATYDFWMPGAGSGAVVTQPIALWVE